MALGKVPAILLAFVLLYDAFCHKHADIKRYKLLSCQNVCEALIYVLDNIYIGIDTKLYRQIVGIPMGTNCAPLVTSFFLCCYERDFITSLSDVKQAEIFKAFNSTSRYLDDLLNIDKPYFVGMVNRMYPPDLQLNKTNTSDTEKVNRKVQGVPQSQTAASPDIKRKRKMTKTNTNKTNKQLHEKHTDQLPLPQAR